MLPRCEALLITLNMGLEGMRTAETEASACPPISSAKLIGPFLSSTTSEAAGIFYSSLAPFFELLLLLIGGLPLPSRFLLLLGGVPSATEASLNSKEEDGIYSTLFSTPLMGPDEASGGY